MPPVSYGCMTCRQRRIKCDEREGSCRNCERRGIVCPGYPDRFDVLLRLSTAEASNAPQSYSRRTNEGPNTHRLDSGQVYGAVGAITPLPNEPDAVALAVYYSSQCIDGAMICSLRYVQSLGNGCLFAAIKAVSHAELSQRYQFSVSAQSQEPLTASYNEAIRSLNAALASPKEFTKDSTLLATLLMAAIEMKATPDRSLSYWDLHTQGAAALLQARGVEQVTSRIGSALFFQMSTQLAMSCILAKRSLPRELWQLRAGTEPFLISDFHPVWRFQTALFHFTDFYAAASSTSDTREAEATIIAAFEVYNELLSVFTNTDATWQSTTIPSARFPGVVAYEHQYPSVLTAQLWNGLRTAILILCDFVASIDKGLLKISNLPANVQAFSKNAIRILNQTALDSIAAIPIAVDQMQSRAGDHTMATDFNICGRGYTVHSPVFQETKSDHHGMPLMHGCLLQWSIYFGAQSTFTDMPIRQHLWQILDGAGQRLHMKQWQALAKELRPILQPTG